MATSNVSSVLKDVVAYVDVWSSDKNANYSKPFIHQLQEMGAQVTKTFTKQVTHVVFNNGHPATWRKATKSNVNLVSVLWVGRCYDESIQVDEKLFPALNETNPVLKNKKHRCMQPKDSPERTPDSNKRLKRKLDKMMKEIVPIEPLVTDMSPIIIDEKNGIVYSPALKRSDYMARRLRYMKEKHEDISPTASQMVESPSAVKPSLGSSPSFFKFPYEQSDEESSASVAETGCSPAKEEVRALPGVSNQCLEHLRKEETEKPRVSPSNEVIRHTSISPLECPNFEENEDKDDNNQKRSSRVSKRMSVKRNSTESDNLVHLPEAPGTSDNKKHDKKESKRSKIKSPRSASKDHKQKTGGKRDKETKKHTGKPWMSPSNETYMQTSISPLKCDNFEENEKEEKTKLSRRVSRRLSVKQNSTESDSFMHLSETLEHGTFDSKKHSTKDAIFPKNVKSSSFSDTLDDSAAGLSEDITSPLPKKEQTITNQAPIFSALVQASPSVSHKTVPCSTDGDDDVFEDYFTANHKQTSKNLQLPFVLDTKKRKPRRSESAASETNSSKKKKIEVYAIPFNQHDVKDTSEGHSQPYKKQLSKQDISRTDLTQLTKIKRQSALPFASISTTTTRQRLSMSVHPTNPHETQALETHKDPDACVQRDTLTSGGNEDTLMTELTVAASKEHSKQGTTSLHDMIDKTKVGRTMVMTSMPTEKQNTVVQLVKALGGFSLVGQVCASTTHVVSDGHRRTLNVLLGIARGCWVLSFEWILWSLEKRQWIPEEPYELSDQFPAAQICRLQRHLSAGEHQQDLFQDLPAIFVSQHSQPPTQGLIELIQLCGGTVCKTVRQAGICIGKYSGRRPEGSRILSEQWVLDSITHLKQLPYADYLLG